MRLSVIVAAALATGCTSTPDMITPWTSGVDFSPMGAATGAGAFSATINGSTAKAAPYTIRVHITKGGKILPHTHPDDRVITVVAGNLCYGFGNTFSEQGCTVYPEGMPIRARIGANESGFGPSAFVLPKE